MRPPNDAHHAVSAKGASDTSNAPVVALILTRECHSPPHLPGRWLGLGSALRSCDVGFIHWELVQWRCGVKQKFLVLVWVWVRVFLAVGLPPTPPPSPSYNLYDGDGC